MRRILILLLSVIAVVVAAPRDGAAQAPDVSLRVTVSDATGAVIVGARVLVRQEGQAERRATTGERGQATLVGLAAQTAEIVVEFDGFEPSTLSKRLRSGTNRLDVQLQIAKVAVNVDVSRDAREKSTDARGDSFARVLGPDQIAALPDDPDELQRVLNLMAGPGAIMRVNGFGGANLPPKGQIRQIRISFNAFSSEMHELGTPIIDIFSQPGLDTWHTTMNAGFRNNGLTARYAYAPTSSGEHVQRAGITLDGPVWRNHTSLSITMDGFSLADAQTIRASTPAGQINAVATRPTDRTTFSIQVEHALTKTHTTTFELARNGTSIDNLGVGGSSLLDRAYATNQNAYTMRVSDMGSLGKRFFNELHVQTNWNDQSAQSVTAQPAVIVLDAFSMGGAQVDNSRNWWELEARDDLDFARGHHAMRTGVLLQAGHYLSSDQGNRFGTFTFSNPTTYLAGQPALFTQRVGDPTVEYGFYRAGWYFQDDVKVHKSLTLTVGARHEFQSHIADRLNVAPRGGFTWAPLPNGKLIVRGGAGIVYNWFDSTTYEQTLRVDGQRQYDIVIANPGYPDPFAGALPYVLPPSRFLQSSDLHLPRILHGSLAVERRFNLLTVLTLTYTHQRGDRLFRGLNLNAPLADGSRPYPTQGNVIAVESAGRSELDRLDISFSRAVVRNMKPMFVVAVMYTLARQNNDTDGPFSPPSDNTNPAVDWGPAASDVRHRGMAMVMATLPKGFSLTGIGTATSAPPYNITTGADDNHDTVINDRPAGGGRNSARGSGDFEVLARLGWTLGFGKPPATQAGMPNMRRLRSDAARDPLGAGSAVGQQARRYRIQFYVQAYNLLNRVNRIGYRGVLTAPLFGQATASMPPRRLEIGTRFDF